MILSLSLVEGTCLYQLQSTFSLIIDGIVSGPHDWGSVSLACNGGAQSPVDIATKDAIKREYDTALKLDFRQSENSRCGDTDKGKICGTFLNDGHSLVFQVNGIKNVLWISSTLVQVIFTEGTLESGKLKQLPEMI